MITHYVSTEKLIDDYRLTYLDFKLAKSEDDQWKARMEMARLEAVAYDCGYGDEIIKKMRSCLE